MPTVDEPMEMVVAPTSERAIFALLFIVVIAFGALLFWVNSQSGKKWQLETMQVACAEGKAAPQQCDKEGIPMTWEVNKETSE